MPLAIGRPLWKGWRKHMVLLHRLDGKAFYLNAELIETVEATPDTVIVLSNGHRYIVLEQAEEVIARILSYRRLVNSPLLSADSEGQGGR